MGLDNSGNMRFDVHEEMEQGVFNTSGSLFWTQFREAFADEIFNRYKELRSYSDSHSSYTTKSFLEYFYDNQISKISETNYNNNFKQKYLLHDDYLFMMHGRQYEYLRRWIDQRLYFLDSYYEYGEDWGKESTIRVEYGDFATSPVTFNIKTYQPSYIAVKFTANAGNTKKLKVPRGATVTFEGYVNTATDQEVILFNSPNIKSIGDISPYTPKTVDISRMTKLTELCVGSEEHPNPNLTSISLGNNTYLTKLELENCTALGGTVDVSNCTNLQYVSTIGSTITYVRFNDAGGALEEAHFSYATKTVNLSNFQLLREISFENIDNLTTLRITNCPLITGYRNNDNTVTPGYIMTIINDWEPTDNNTNIEMEIYGNLTQYKFLDACSLLHEKNGLTNRRINLSGQVTYLGDIIPDRYSTYSSAIRENNFFPDLTIYYPNVTDFSGMFANYKNINAIMSKTVYLKDEMNQTYSQLRYYWKDLKEDKYPDELNAEFNECGYRGRQVKYYDDDDMKIVADEIKDRMSPFSRAFSFNEMFMNDEFIEYIHPDTFDHMDVYNATTTSMFDGCLHLKYIEFPKIRSIDQMAFNNCKQMVIYIPKETNEFNDLAFSNIIFLEGVHPVFLFEEDKENIKTEIPFVRDARFGIKRNVTTGRALNTCDVEFDNVAQTESGYSSSKMAVKFDYFEDNNGKLVYDIYKSDGSTIFADSFGYKCNDGMTLLPYENELGISELLYGSMKNFDVYNLKMISVPTFGVKNISPNTTPLYKEELSIAKLFFNEVNLSKIQLLGSIERVDILTDYNTVLTDYYMQDNKNIKKVYCQNSLTEIGQYAFKDSGIEEFDIEDSILNPHLVTIGDYAFSNAQLARVYIPNTVTNIGERAYEKNDMLMDLKYSTAMTYVPIGCFAKCDTKDVTCSTISGFSSTNIVEFMDFAFDGSTGLQIVKHDDSLGEYNCYWTEDTTQSHFLDYFENLASIGNCAFRGVKEIYKIKLNSRIKGIGQAAFVPHQSEYTNTTLLEWDLSENNDYSETTIYSHAFAGRQFDWYSNNYNYYTGIVPKTVFIPASLGVIEVDAFSPSSSMCVNTASKLNFVLSNISNADVTALWDPDYAQNYTTKVYNYYTTYITEDGESQYALLNDNTAIYMRLLKDASSITFPAYIEFNFIQYTLKEITNNALIDHDNGLSIIAFDYSSEITKFGKQIFDSRSLSTMYVIGKLNPETGREYYIPTTVTEIGEGTNFAGTTWYGIQGLDDFLYLNNVCLGYSEGNVSLEDNQRLDEPKLIKNTTQVIYDNAFYGKNRLQSIQLPTSLKRIGENAFAQCSSLSSIDFTPCANNLNYIGDRAFDGDASLTSIRYTKALHHVGAEAVAGTSITKYIFDQGCALDEESDPIEAKEITLDHFDNRVTFVKISDSMGSFFEPGGTGWTSFAKLNNIGTLILGEYEEVVLPPVPEDELTEDELASGDAYYLLNLNAENIFYPNGVYRSIQEVDGQPVTVYNDIILHVKSNIFYKPLSTYTHDINISKLTTNLLDNEDVIRIGMGYKPGEIHTIFAKTDFINLANRSMYLDLFNGRFTVSRVN